MTAATLKVLDAAGAPADLPVARGCAEPLVCPIPMPAAGAPLGLWESCAGIPEAQVTPGYLLRQTLALLPQVEPVHYCPLIHGSDGLGDLDPPLPPSARRLDPRHAVTLIVDTLRAAEERGEQLTLIALAPLTNVAMALRLEPELCRRALGRVVWMGGAAFKGGNASQWVREPLRAMPGMRRSAHCWCGPTGGGKRGVRPGGGAHPADLRRRGADVHLGRVPGGGLLVARAAGARLCHAIRGG